MMEHKKSYMLIDAANPESAERRADIFVLLLEKKTELAVPISYSTIQNTIRWGKMITPV